MAYYDKEEVITKATGMWPTLLQRITTIPSTVFSKKHQACPMCTPAHEVKTSDRFRFDDERFSKGDGGYICSQCGAGTGLDLLMRSTGMDFKDAMQELGNAMAMIPVEKVALVKKQISASSSLPKRASVFTEEAEQIIQCCVPDRKIPPFFAKYSDGKFRCQILNDYDSVFPVINAGGIMVNAAVVDPYGDIDWAGDKQTDGGFSVIGANSEKWIVCCNIGESIKIHESTGLRVICTWGDLNLDETLISLGDMKSRCFIACNHGEIDTVKTADTFNMKVVQPEDGNTIIDSGIVRKALKAEDLL